MATTAQDMGMTMTQEDRIAMLQNVEAELGLVMAGLDTASEQCDDCGHKRYSNWDERQAAEAIQGAMTRVEKARRLLINGTTSAHGDNG